ncbi:MAG TPA: DUF4149 domain-containing protein [Oxalobacteraceae bacterium]|jgi:hypothetical protein|nr:DUF4149 domain-containing protein [Oxalobacteraceae bacterium]
MLRAARLIAVLWVGSLWTVGYLVAPTLFATLSDRVQAGTIAGSMFRVEAWLSIFCAIVLIVLLRSRSSASRNGRRMQVLVFSMLAATLVSHFALQPLMASLREAAGPTGVMAPDVKMQFGILHGISSAIYLLESLLGVALLLALDPEPNGEDAELAVR